MAFMFSSSLFAGKALSCEKERKSTLRELGTSKKIKKRETLM